LVRHPVLTGARIPENIVPVDGNPSVSTSAGAVDNQGVSRYRKIDPRIWNDSRFRALSDDGKLTFLLLLTHPGMTALGAMRGTTEGLAAEMHWDCGRMRSALEESVGQGTIDVDREASFFALPNFLRYNQPEGPNSVTRAWKEALDLIPECDGKVRLVDRCRAYLQSRSESFRVAIGVTIADALGMPLPKPCLIQEQEQEQEKEQEEEGASPMMWEEPRGLRPPDVIGAWNANRGGMAEAQAITPERRKRILSFLRKRPDLTTAGFGDVVKALGTDPWACGLTPRRSTPLPLDELLRGDAFERQREKVATRRSAVSGAGAAGHRTEGRYDDVTVEEIGT
jgi:hypothetical protein